MTFASDANEKYLEAEAVLNSKHHDYGPKNIAGAPGGPLNGLNVRLSDKLDRLEHLLATGKNPSHESIRDTFLDIANYGIIGMMVIDGNWPGTPSNLDKKLGPPLREPEYQKIDEEIKTTVDPTDGLDFEKLFQEARRGINMVGDLLETFGKKK